MSHGAQNIGHNMSSACAYMGLFMKGATGILLIRARALNDKEDFFVVESFFHRPTAVKWFRCYGNADPGI